MLPDHPLGNTGLEQVPYAAMVLVTEHEEVHVDLFRALEDDLGDIMVRGTNDFSVGFDACCSQPIDELLYSLSLIHI